MSHYHVGYPMFDYLCDGVYWDWEEEERNIGYSDENIFDEEKVNNEIIFSRKFSSSETYRTYHFFDLLISNISEIVKRYCKYENLTVDYAEVAKQKNVLKDIILVHIADLDLQFNLNDITKINTIIPDIYINKNRKSVYNRVGLIQNLLHELASEQKKDIADLDKEVMRKLLSLCRLHIAISDIRKKNINLIKRELIQNHFDSMDYSPPLYVTTLNKQYVQSWKKRHLKSLLHFCPEDVRLILRNLINLKQPFNKSAVQEVIFYTNE